MDLSILEQLREQTRPAHLALETQPLLQRLLSSRLTRAEYGQVLQAMLAFYQALEPELVPATAALLRRHPSPDYEYLPRVPLLADDCRALGCASAGFIHPPVAIRLDSSGACIPGVLYVIEGSTQGGKLIAKHLAHLLSAGEQSGTSFFDNRRWDHSWPMFRRWLVTDLAQRCQIDIKSVVEGADMTFAALHAHLDQWQVLPHGK